MLLQDVVDWKNKKVGSVELDANVFGRDINLTLLHEVVRWQLAARRQGTHMTKTKGLVSGGGKKPFKQKGTGGARQGSTRSILMPGGGTAFGPQPRSYYYSLPKKVRKAAIANALSYLVKEGKLTIVDQFKSSGKTKELSQNLLGLGLNKAVMIDDSEQEFVLRACRNLPKFKYSSISGLNVYDLLKYDRLVLSQKAVDGIIARFKDGE